MYIQVLDNGEGYACQDTWYYHVLEFDVRVGHQFVKQYEGDADKYYGRHLQDGSQSVA